MMLKYRERHCPKKNELLHCLIPAPPKYKNPFRWPQSREYAWYDNLPHRELSIEKAIQNWIQVEDDRFRFPGGGPMFPRGADAYIDDIDALIPWNLSAFASLLFGFDRGVAAGRTDLGFFEKVVFNFVFPAHGWS
ncbi:hypothetical protein OPV22_008244 [Ensete ventricosum]|uniref:Methyltransferase n=1 Tax=Ensete ventricosum TaxID=4639 RepID=A0AAV8RAM4_ENSVE|nr:hypothetical protein OPV22_008244 [Ensete ventricosum]